MVLISKKEYENLQSTIGTLSDQLSELKRMIFGSKSERFVPLSVGQLGLFPEPIKEESVIAEDHFIGLHGACTQVF